MVKIKHHSRKFLNKTTGVAAIETNIDTTPWCGGVDGSITLTDCSRQISLDFSIYDVKDLDTKIAKLHLLLDEISAFRDVYTANYDAIKEDLITREKERKKKLKKGDSVEL
jgi:hypothetical protein